MGKIAKRYIDKTDLIDDIAKTIHEVYSHPLKWVDIHIQIDTDEPPTMKVEYETYIIERNE